MGRRIAGVGAAVLLAAVGTAALVGFVRGAESRALAGEEVVEVLVVADAVARNTPAEDIASAITTERVPAKVRATNGVSDLETLQGQVTAVDLVPGEQLVAARFVTPAQLAEQSGVDVPEGLQQVTIAVEPHRAVGGQVAPGDVVGLIASFSESGGEEGGASVSKMNHQQLLVTNVQVDQTTPAMGEEGTEDSGPARAPTGSLLVTLAVDTGQAERIVHAAEFGTIWLTAQDGDTEQGGSSVRNAGNVFDD